MVTPVAKRVLVSIERAIEFNVCFIAMVMKYMTSQICINFGLELHKGCQWHPLDKENLTQLSFSEKKCIGMQTNFQKFQAKCHLITHLTFLNMLMITSNHCKWFQETAVADTHHFAFSLYSLSSKHSILY